MMTFYQQGSFTIAMMGLFLDQLVGKGWGSSAMFMLRTIVDPKISYLSVNLFMILICINSMITSMSIA